jgi:hypothetical protein
MSLADKWLLDEYDTEDGQEVGTTYADVGLALSIWFACQGSEKTVADAAAAFNMSEVGIRKAIEAAGNPWFSVMGDNLVSDGL